MAISMTDIANAWPDGLRRRLGYSVDGTKPYSLGEYGAGAAGSLGNYSGDLDTDYVPYRWWNIHNTPYTPHFDPMSGARQQVSMGYFSGKTKEAPASVILPAWSGNLSAWLKSAVNPYFQSFQNTGVSYADNHVGNESGYAGGNRIPLIFKPGGTPYPYDHLTGNGNGYSDDFTMVVITNNPYGSVDIPTAYYTASYNYGGYYGAVQRALSPFYSYRDDGSASGGCTLAYFHFSGLPLAYPSQTRLLTDIVCGYNRAANQYGSWNMVFFVPGRWVPYQDTVIIGGENIRNTALGATTAGFYDYTATLPPYSFTMINTFRYFYNGIKTDLRNYPPYSTSSPEIMGWTNWYVQSHYYNHSTSLYFLRNNQNATVTGRLARTVQRVTDKYGTRDVENTFSFGAVFRLTTFVKQ